MKRKVDFDWYCKTKKDVINNAAYELIVALTAKSRHRGSLSYPFPSGMT